MNKLLLLVFFSCAISFGQSKEERAAALKAKKENNLGQTYSGLTFSVGDTLAFNDMDKYLSVYKGKGLSAKKVDYSLKNTKCMISKFKKQYGYDYTFCKDFDNQIYAILLKSSILLDEIKLTDKQKQDLADYLNPPRDMPEDFIPFNFQGVTWKTSKNELRKAFPDLDGKDNSYGLSTNVAGLDADLLFSYTRDNLNVIGYVFNEEHSSKNLYIKDYLKLKELLIEKYGEPIKDKKIWGNSLYKGDYEDYGMAISVGHLTYFATWELPDTNIMLRLSGDNYKINHVLAYHKYPKDKTEKSKSDLSKL